MPSYSRATSNAANYSTSQALNTLLTSRIEKQISSVIHSLTEGSPADQKNALDTYFLPDSSFIHPLCRVPSFEKYSLPLIGEINSRWVIWMIYRWYKILSPRIVLNVECDGTAFLPNLFVTHHCWLALKQNLTKNPKSSSSKSTRFSPSSSSPSIKPMSTLRPNCTSSMAKITNTISRVRKTCISRMRWWSSFGRGVLQSFGSGRCLLPFCVLLALWLLLPLHGLSKGMRISLWRMAWRKGCRELNAGEWYKVGWIYVGYEESRHGALVLGIAGRSSLRSCKKQFSGHFLQLSIHFFPRCILNVILSGIMRENTDCPSSFFECQRWKWEKHQEQWNDC